MARTRLAVLAAAFSLVVAPFAFAGPQVAGRPHGALPHGHAGQHGAAGRHGKAAQPHGQAGDQNRDRVHGAAAASDTDIATRISRNPQLKARLEAMLPSGMTLDDAAAGFRNQGQFIAALEASKNQNIPFADLKAQMTGDNALSLGQAIQKLKPAPTTTGVGADTEKPEAPDTDTDTDKD